LKIKPSDVFTGLAVVLIFAAIVWMAATRAIRENRKLDPVFVPPLLYGGEVTSGGHVYMVFQIHSPICAERDRTNPAAVTNIAATTNK